MEVYSEANFDVETKSNDSPVTKADLAANRLIIDALSKLKPKLPLVSEENDPTANQTAMQSDRYWMIDPLDGTREFIDRVGEFVVNIALIEKGRPIAGVVYLPTLKTAYAGIESVGAFKIGPNDVWEAINVSANTTVKSMAVSRSHLDEKTRNLITKFGPDTQTIPAGSALKLCLVADGSVDAHFRLVAGLHDWDIAAGDAVVRAAGGRIVTLDGQPLTYGHAGNKLPEYVCDNGKIDLGPILKP